MSRHSTPNHRGPDAVAGLRRRMARRPAEPLAHVRPLSQGEAHEILDALAERPPSRERDQAADKVRGALKR